MDLDNLKLILVPTDFSEASETAVGVAVQLARKLHAAIELFHVDIDPSLMLPPPADAIAIPGHFARVLASSAERLERAVAEIQQAGVVCTSAEDFGRSHTAIVERARVTAAGLIVMGTHGRQGLGHALMGSVAEKVVQHSPCLVLVVPVAASGDAR